MAGIADSKQQAETLEEQGRIDDAIVIYAQLLEAFDQESGELDVGLFEHVGDLVLLQGDLAAALAWYEKGVDWYAEAGIVGAAIALCQKILRHAPHRDNVQLKLATLSAMESSVALDEPSDVFGRMRGPAPSPLVDEAPPTGKPAQTIDEVAAHTSSPDVVLDIFGPPTAMPTGVQDVLLGASAPRSAGRGDEFTARFVAYLAEDELGIRELFTDLSERSASHLGMRSMRWLIGTEVAVTVSGRGLEVSPASRNFVWNGARVVLEFDVLVGDSARAGSTCVLKYDVAVAGMLVTSIRCDLVITRDRGLGTIVDRPTSVPRTAFASYASQDRDRVVDRVAALTAVAKMDVFLDSLSLTTGERWEERLNSEILSREVFLLFWSANARASKWVTWEWQTALRERGLETILPQPLEPVEMAPVPPELAALHFGDRHLLLRSSGRGPHTPSPSESPPPS